MLSRLITIENKSIEEAIHIFLFLSTFFSGLHFCLLMSTFLLRSIPLFPVRSSSLKMIVEFFSLFWISLISRPLKAAPKKLTRSFFGFILSTITIPLYNSFLLLDAVFVNIAYLFSLAKQFFRKISVIPKWTQFSSDLTFLIATIYGNGGVIGLKRPFLETNG